MVVNLIIMEVTTQKYLLADSVCVFFFFVFNIKMSSREDGGAVVNFCFMTAH